MRMYVRAYTFVFLRYRGLGLFDFSQSRFLDGSGQVNGNCSRTPGLIIATGLGMCIWWSTLVRRRLDFKTVATRKIIRFVISWSNLEVLNMLFILLVLEKVYLRSQTYTWTNTVDRTINMESTLLLPRLCVLPFSMLRPVHMDNFKLHGEHATDRNIARVTSICHEH
jgi:hypothetical protein